MRRVDWRGRRRAPLAAALWGVALAPVALATVGFASISLVPVGFAPAAFAQDSLDPPAKRPTVSRTAPPSSNSTINLINLLVKQGVITDEQAQALIRQADEEAYIARRATRDAADRADSAEKTAAAAAAATSPPGTKRIAYVPEIVKQQIREDLRREVMTTAKAERWAAPGTFPEWVSRIRFLGDLRFRYEGDFFPKGNNPFSAVNYNSINTGSPVDVNFGVTNFYDVPTYDTSEDRNRARLRARLGMEADLFDGFWAGLRIGTGDNIGPVSFNQTLGATNNNLTCSGACGGNFSKYAIWLDRAFIKYKPWDNPDDLVFSVGRFDNPFFHPTDLVWHRDLGFDGAAVQLRGEIAPGVAPFVVGGAFPLYNTDFNAGPNDFLGNKARSHDKWMVGAQIGSKFLFVPQVELTLGLAYYDFMNVRGHLSSPCFASDVKDVCDTDLTRPSFAQKGNTYMKLRDVVQRVPGAVESEYQYFGLAAAFQDVVMTGRLDLGHFHPVHVILDGEYVRNVAFDRDDVAAKAYANPLGTGPFAPNTGLYVGGNEGWLARMTVGHKKLEKLWDWDLFAGYKWLESDAVIDAFTDSDFGLGGTNLKGYFIGGNLGLGANVWASARWLSANQVAGAPYAVDVVQVDLNARF